MCANVIIELDFRQQHAAQKIGNMIEITKPNWSQVTVMSLPDKILSKCILVLWFGSLLDLRVPLVVREKKAVDR